MVNSLRGKDLRVFHYEERAVLTRQGETLSSRKSIQGSTESHPTGTPARRHNGRHND
jgi:hypothetical protein